MTSLQQQEDSLLASLHEDKLVVATADNVKAGVPLFYKLGDTYGCHILRGADDLRAGYAYKDVAGLRAGVAAGNFYIINNDS